MAAEKADYDAWIGVLLAGIVLHILMWMIYRLLLSWINSSILELQTYMFGKLFGTGLNLLFLIYFFIVSASILHTYIEIVQVWMFPTVSTFILAMVMCMLVYYIVSSGFRGMTAICVLSIFISILYIFSCIYCMLNYGEMHSFLPIWNHSIQDIGDTMKKYICTMARLEIILMIYPFIHNPTESHRFAQYGLLFSNPLYLS
ncbi:GerAB/ArcD/ProY family transporter [Bacillus cereus]|uniref:GerAB/ArcD/ProY family transporter n=1 Tax=Bacillus cereus TaxID=1396 RepID=UPI0027DB0EAA|nr:GerAB/ArcD/ProY family transporter [Bacillus cereus]